MSQTTSEAAGGVELIRPDERFRVACRCECGRPHCDGGWRYSQRLELVTAMRLAAMLRSLAAPDHTIEYVVDDRRLEVLITEGPDRWRLDVDPQLLEIAAGKVPLARMRFARAAEAVPPGTPELVPAAPSFAPEEEPTGKIAAPGQKVAAGWLGNLLGWLGW